MSSIKTTQIDGDVSVGRNVTIGGKGSVAGNFTVGHNLKVDGWLDAKNIKGANKGVFTDITSLRTAYPDGTLPDGSWAIVGGTLPGELWYVNGGAWVDSGKTAGNVTVDVEQYLDEVQTMNSDIESMKVDISDIQKKNDTQDANISNAQNGITANTALIGKLSTDLSTETSERKSADNTLDQKISDEASARANADTNLQTTLQGNIDAEAEDRAKADKLLQGNIDALAKAGYLFKGIATPKTTPEKPTENVFYIATESGSYSNFGTGIFATGLDDNTIKEVTISVSDGEIAFLMYDGYPSANLDLGAPPNVVGWYKVRLDISSAVETAVKNRLSGVKNGVAPLDEQEVVPMDYLPTWELESNYLDVIMVDYWVKDGDNLPLANASNEGKYYYDEKMVKLFHAEATTQGDVYVWNTQGLSEKIIYVDKTSNMMYRYDNTKNKLIAVSSNSSGGAYNPSAEDGRLYVLCDTSDTSNSAVHVAKRNGEAKLGLLLTFALKKGTWKTYQYVGSNTDDESWYDTDNWKDFGSMVQGSEAMIDLDTLVPLPTGYYTLGTALSALKTYQESTGVSYQKRGLVISYAVEANKVETKQYQGDSALTDDFWEASLWQDFGGGSKLTASDTMEDGGTDAFSTGGAYKAVPAEIEADTSNEGSVKIQLKNKGGDVLSEAQFPVGTGTGGGGGTTLAINFADDPFYVRAGGTAILKAAIRSVTQLADGSSQDNKITSVVFTNRTTKTVVASFRPNQASSSSLKAYNFEFDLSGIAQNAGSVELQAVATDSTGQTATRNCELIAVDVTVESSQTLNYTKDTSLQVGGVKVSIPMYRFPHNASDKGIQTKIEIYKNSAWEVLDNVMVRDTYTHNVTIDPTGLGHGAYPLRIQGTDVASGITGNVLHTAVMVIEQRESVSDYNKPIIVARWSDDNDGKVKLFQTVTFDIACYQRSNANPTVEVTVTDVTNGATEVVASKMMNRSSSYSVEKRIVGYSDGDTLTFDAVCGTSSLAEKLTTVIDGSLLDIAETEGAYYKISLAGRSNSDTDKRIRATAADGGEVEIKVSGSNYSSNGFVADNFGTGKASGRMALRVAENVTAECTDRPFASNTIPTNGLALSLTFKVRNIADRNAQIIKCMGGRLGFVLTGEKFIVTTGGDSGEALKSVFTTAATSYLDDTEYRIDIVVEPQARAPYSGVMLCKVYQNGDESACVPIDTSNGFPSFDDTIHFDGTDADLYLYEITRWNSYYDFVQAFNNYIVNLTDTQAMLTEYERNQVLADVTAEGATKPRPDMQKLLDRGVMVCVMTRTADKNLSGDGSAVSDSNIYYPDYIEDLKDKKTTVLMDWYLYFPDRPWANCKVEAVPVTNQGTSTLAYAIKNKKAKFKKAKGITLLYARDEISAMYSGDEDILAKWDDAAKLAKKKKIRIKEGSTPINTITVKVDYSDSAGANNCALMEQMNDVQRALGSGYMTPAQNFDTDKSELLHTSIDGITCALFRTDYKIGQGNGSEAATLPENAYFHSKANFNADKDNPHFFGFEDVEGYNLGCVNYGDFKEMVTPRGTDIDDYKATVLADTSSLVPGTLYMLSEFCGPKYRFLENDGTGKMTETSSVSVDDEHVLDKTLAEVLADDVANYDWGTAYATSDGKFVQYKGGNWKDTTGSMTFDKATRKWSITGRVLNPVECYEYRQYQEFCWQQGVNTVDDMLKTLHTDDGDVPVWSTYYESRYPDDDDLNDLYAQGKKVPYRLFAELQFCQQCNQNLSEDANANAAKNADGSEAVFNGAGASTTITLDGKEVPGTKENRLLKWQHEMHKWFNPYSTQCYVVSSDYKATVDQRAKNMMIGFYLETDGTVRGYFNHWYDGDSCDEADNDCYLTIPWDMDGATSHLYQGWDGVMFRQCYALFDKGEGVWTDGTGASVLTLHDVAAAMRVTKTAAGLDIFSADGCYRYWMTSRILKWPKVVSSFDGERKYIETATAADNHYPALHGLRLDSLPAFQRKRFAYRDGYFQCGDLFKKFFQARMMGPITVRITAAQDGYFGMGVDSTSSAKYSCYLKAGESHTFTETAAGEGGKLIYIFGADKLSGLDLSGCAPKNSNWMIADCTLLRKLVIGGEGYSPAYTNDILSALNLGQMPFLEEVDIRGTKILTLNAGGCPRLRRVLAGGSLLQTLSVAEASPVDTVQLPATMTALVLRGLPALSYSGGLAIEGFKSLKTLLVESCPKIDGARLLTDAVAGGAKLEGVRLTGLGTTGASATLLGLKAAGAAGLAADGSPTGESGVCTGLQGEWTLADFVDDATLAGLKAYFTALELYNAQYTLIEFDDAVENGYDGNITNLDNGTRDGDGLKGYVPSGHIARLQGMLHVYKGTYNESTGKMRCEQLSDSDYTMLKNGGGCDVTDSNGAGYDIFLGLPHYWYKGINDHVNQKKYIAYSTEEAEPRSSARNVSRGAIGGLLVKRLVSVYVENFKEGDTFDESALTASSANNVYRKDVAGMRQVRWPGINSDQVGALFLDAAGKVIKAVTTYISSALSDFVQGEYVFTAVPDGAAWFVFTTPQGCDELECIAVDSAEVEAVEPDWVEHKFELIGTYKASVDNLMRLRSVSGAQVVKGNNNSVTSNYWKYDNNGDLTVGLPQAGTSLNYTCKDMLNLARCRGGGYQLVDYEQHKDIANLWMAIHGRRNSQSVNGAGVGQTTTGGTDLPADPSPMRESGNSQRPRTMGLEDWWGMQWETLDNVALNVPSYAAYYRNKCEAPAGSVVDHVWHIRMPDGSERAVQGVSGDLEIARVRHGRYCDVVPSKVVSNTSYNTHYCDQQQYNGGTGRCVLRSGHHSNANCGLVCVCAWNVSSSANGYCGARLAFRGACEIAE